MKLRSYDWLLALLFLVSSMFTNDRAASAIFLIAAIAIFRGKL